MKQRRAWKPSIRMIDMEKFVIVFLSALLLVALVYVISQRCRVGHPGLAKLRGWYYAHRGLHGNGVPENSMEAFRLALEGGYGIELDVHLMADGNLAVIHDASLKRTAGEDVKIENLTLKDLDTYRLEGTDEKIPTFRQVLDLFDGKAPLIVELKAEGGNHAALTNAVCNMLDTYEGVYCLESFDPRCILWLKKNRPEFIRGQLSENFIKATKTKLPGIIRFIMTFLLTNFINSPDFVAYKFADRKNPSVWLSRKLWGVQGVTWTIKSKEDSDQADIEGWISIFEGFNP